MHIPSHALSPEIAIASAAVALPLLARAIQRAAEETGKLPQLAAASLFVFGMQLLQIAVPGGSSAHLLGAAWLGILFGPWLASLGMAAVFLVQAVALGDGGLDALGANILNGGIVPAFLGHHVFETLRGDRSAAMGRRLTAALLGGFLSLGVGAGFASIQLSLSGFAPLAATVPAILGAHLPWAAIEGLGTALLAAAYLSSPIQRLRPRTVRANLIAIGLAAAALAPWVSSTLPDALQRCIEKATG